MAKINWTFQALEDLNDIGEYLSQNSETYTKCIIDLLWEKAHLLENYPKLGKKKFLTLISQILENYSLKNIA